MRSVLAGSLVMAGLVACGRATDPGPPPTSPNQTSELAGDSLRKPASLLKRLAEAADGNLAD